MKSGRRSCPWMGMDLVFKVTLQTIFPQRDDVLARYSTAGGSVGISAGGGASSTTAPLS